MVLALQAQNQPLLAPLRKAEWPEREGVLDAMSNSFVHSHPVAHELELMLIEEINPSAEVNATHQAVQHTVGVEVITILRLRIRP